MTYCLSALVDAGIVFASDSRTHAGVDHVSTYSKMHTFAWDGERVLVLLSAGNLGTTQAVLRQIDLDLADEGVDDLRSLAHLHQVAEYIGRLSLRVQQGLTSGGMQQSVSFEATFILGGQRRGLAPEMYLIYPQGNYITSSPEQPFFQIGETKYGKPILDRIIQPSLSLESAARCALVSIDSTMRSNLSVGPPIDVLLYSRDSLRIDRRLRLKTNSPYFMSVRKQWAAGLKRLFEDLPPFDWERQTGQLTLDTSATGPAGPTERE